MIKRLLTLAFVVLSTTANAAVPPEWTTEARSKLVFSTTALGDAFSGSFTRWVARVRFDPANLGQSRVNVVVDTLSARTGNAQGDETLPGAEWFAARVFPTATFRSTSIRALGGQRFVVNGLLKVRSVERSVSLPFTLAITGNRAVAKGSLTIDRRAFGVGQGQFASTETVAANVRVEITLVARKKK